MRVALAQVKPVTGDLEGNVAQIIRDIRRAKMEGADLVVFPETAITGYCCGALFENEDFIRANKSLLEDIIAKEVPEDLVAVVGYVDIKGRKRNGTLDISNAVAVIQNGEVVQSYDKILMANDNHHEDRKYFTPGEEVKVAEVLINGKLVKLGTPICEDVWYWDHDRDVVQEFVDAGAELIVSPNVSYFFYGKQEVRHRLFGNQAKRTGVPVVAINTAGVGDIVKNIMVYDGGSMVYDSHGNLAAELERFGEDFQTVEVDLKKPVAAPQKPRAWEKWEEIYDALVFEQKEMFRVIGIRNAQVHMSGGLDSSVVGSLVVDAMGTDHTIFISNPTEDNGDVTKGNAQYTADQLGVTLHWNPTQGPYEATVAAHVKAFGEPSLTGRACMQAVLRTVQGIGAYHHFQSGIVATGNHTEIVEGWATFHDIGSIGVHAPIGDLTKVELYQFAAYINERQGKEVIPVGLYDGTIKPAAELADAQEDPIDYWVRSGIDAEIIRNRKSVDRIMHDFLEHELTDEFFPLDNEGRAVYDKYTPQEFAGQVTEAYRNSQRSVFKSAQGAPIVILSPRSRGFSNRETIINRFPGWYRPDEARERIYRRVEE